MKRQFDEIADELLVLRAQDGDKQSFQILVKRWQKRLLKHAAHVTGRPDAAGEIVQESWLAVVRGLRKLKDPAAFRGWVYRIVHNRAVDWIRQRKTQEQAILDLQHSGDHNDGNRDNTADSGNEDITELRQAINRLEADDKLLVRMFYTDNMRISEIAQAWGMPPGTIKYRLFRIREQLRIIIQSDDRPEEGESS